MNKKQLYKSVFENVENYTDFFFDRRRSNIHIFESKHGDDCIAMVGVVDILLNSSGNLHKTALITGVCTHPNMRGKGVMQTLLDNVLNKLKDDEYELAILSPVNDNYYKKYGFNPFIVGNFKKTYYQKNDDYSCKNMPKIDTKLLLKLYKAIASKYDCYQVVNNDIILDILEEYQIDGINIDIILKDNTPIGWCVVENEKIKYAVLPDMNILNYIAKFDGLTYFEQDTNGNKEMFQIKYFKQDISPIKLNKAFILNEY